MHLKVEKRIVNLPDFKYKTYFEKGCHYCCKGMDFLYNDGFLVLIDGNKDENLINFIQDKDEDKNIFVGMVRTTMEDYGDYDYDDNYIPNYFEESSYLKINNCPMCGKKIEIEIKENDVSKEYENIKMKYPKGKKTKADKELRKLLDIDLNNLLIGEKVF